MELRQDQERRLAALAEERGLPADVVLQLVKDALHPSNGVDGSDERAGSTGQKAARLALLRELDAFPCNVVDDGLDGSVDHDEILYGKEDE